jgi:hypothetical protein
MKSNRFVSLTAAALFALSTVTSNAGTVAPPPASHSGAGAGFVWGVFGCAGSIIFTAYVAHVRHHRELTQQEAMTCGAIYWLNPKNHR